MATLQDIARTTGVSVSLVSKVLNDRLATTRVTPATVTRIQEAAARLDYRKNMSAIALLAGRHDVVGVFVHNLGMAGSGIVEDLLTGIAYQAQTTHRNLMLSFFDSADAFRSRSEVAHRGRMDGLLVGGCYDADLSGRLLEIQKSGLPVVTLYDVPRHATIPNVGLDQVTVGRIATEHLIARGARRIAHILNMQPRFEGYRQALRLAGLPYDESLVYDPRAESYSYSHTTGENAVRAFLARGVPLDGLAAQSDHEAVGCINALFAVGRRVPEDVRVIGIDNAPFCEFARVPLTSVSQQFRLRGETAMGLLSELIEGRPVQSSELQPRVVARASTR